MTRAVMAENSTVAADSVLSLRNAFLIVGVIDLLEGRAVHARGGNRATYEPVSVPGAPAGDAAALAAFYADLGLDDVYVADLTALGGGAWQREEIGRVGQHVRSLWLDAGVTESTGAAAARELGASHVIVGLETLPSMEALEALCANGHHDVVFSLDLRNRQMMGSSSLVADLTPSDVARQAEAAGVGTIIVLDVARVGIGHGCDFQTLTAIRTAVPSVTLLAGGGVRDAHDIGRLQDAGCDGALIATAILSGTLRPPVVL
jgi:phosphoribosylformimino-5-aminoimidazole carboxamide ribotide isomerase